MAMVFRHRHAGSANARRFERRTVEWRILGRSLSVGRYAAREVARGPVVGIAEAAMHLASFIAPSFSVVTTLGRTRGMAWHLAERYGMKRFCRSVRATDIAVLDLAEPGSDARRHIVAERRAAIDDDGAEAIVLGCAGMADLCDDVSHAVGVPAIDLVAAAIRCVESLIALGLQTAKHGEYARPLAKDFDGALVSFAPREADAALQRSSFMVRTRG